MSSWLGSIPYSSSNSTTFVLSRMAASTMAHWLDFREGQWSIRMDTASEKKEETKLKKEEKRKERNMHGKNTLQEGHSLAHKFLRLPTRLFTQLVNISSASSLNEPWGRKLTEVCSCQRALIQHAMGDLAADRPAWWRWTYLWLSQSSSQLQMISPTLARWH